MTQKWRAVGPLVVDVDTGVEIAECTTHFSDRSEKAKLIATAPEMLKTLISARDAIKTARLDSGHLLKAEILMVDTNERLLDVLDAVISKAKGE